MTEQFAILPITQIQANPYQPRSQFDQKELADLAASIKENGLIQPIIVRQSAIAGYELIAGERRLRASQLAGLEQIAAVIRPLSDNESRVQALVENIQRADLNPIEEAKAIQKLTQKAGTTHDSVAKLLGKSRPYITNSLRLLQLAAPTQAALEEGQISAGHGRLLLGLSETQQRSWLTRIQNQGLSVRALEGLLKAAIAPRKKQTQPKQADVQVQEDLLKEKLGLAVSIHYQEKKQSGYVTISFNNLEEFEQLIHSFKS